MRLTFDSVISSYPYPPDFLSWMRQVFANPQPFIDACLSEYVLIMILGFFLTSHRALKEGYTGYNVDWEPTTTATSQDAILYAQFLTKFTDALHKHNKKVTVDIASWSSIWVPHLHLLPCLNSPCIELYRPCRVFCRYRL